MQSGTLSTARLTSAPETATLSGSPKRKRDVEDVSDLSRSPLRLRVDLPSRPGSESLRDSTSPRSKVSARFQDLHLDHHPQLLPQLSFRGKSGGFGEGGEARSGLHDVGNTFTTETPPLLLLQSGLSGLEVPDFPHRQSHSALRVPSAIRVAPAQEEDEEGAAAAAPFLPQPQTPQLHPESPPQTVPRTISPLPSAAAHSLDMELSADGYSSTSFPFSLPPNPTSAQHLSPPTPPRLNSPPPLPAAPSPASSPSADVPSSSLVWTAVEITGHDPTDPADDGYGINGIGFRPTPAMVQARTLRRRQQVADWKSREAREARGRRAERRMGNGVVAGRTSGGSSGARNNGAGVGQERKVRFAGVEG